MNLNYDGTLTMPATFTTVTNEEMQYVEGGGTVKVVLAAATQKSLITQAVSSATSWLGKTIGTAVGGVVGGVIGGMLGSLIGKFLGGLLEDKIVTTDFTLLTVSSFILPNKVFTI